MTETKMIPCPVKGCRQRCRTGDTLEAHLWNDHNKTELAAALAQEVVAKARRPIEV